MGFKDINYDHNIIISQVFGQRKQTFCLGKPVFGPRKHPVQWLCWSYSGNLGPPVHPCPFKGYNMPSAIGLVLNKIVENLDCVQGLTGRVF